jgi:hypothetical protein
MANSEALKYHVYVDDNFHYMDEDERYLDGSYADCQSAINRCMEIVDRFLMDGYKEGMAAEELLSQYTSFGEDPWITGEANECKFSAWAYAEQKCKEICNAAKDEVKGNQSEKSVGDDTKSGPVN